MINGSGKQKRDDHRENGQRLLSANCIYRNKPTAQTAAEGLVAHFTEASQSRYWIGKISVQTRLDLM